MLAYQLRTGTKNIIRAFAFSTYQELQQPPKKFSLHISAHENSCVSLWLGEIISVEAQLYQAERIQQQLQILNFHDQIYFDEIKNCNFAKRFLCILLEKGKWLPRSDLDRDQRKSLSFKCLCTLTFMWSL